MMGFGEDACPTCSGRGSSRIIGFDFTDLGEKDEKTAEYGYEGCYAKRVC